MTAPLYFQFRDGKYRATTPPPKRTRPLTPRELARRALTDAVRTDFILAADMTCTYCERQGDFLHGADGRRWHLDHVIPLERGGAPGRENVALACATCNRAKGRRTPEEWRASA